jgi:ATP-dependent DNA helicase RecG
MTENQIIEYKQSWHDDYLKWICGFANASGGTLWIGVRDDGSIAGVDDCNHLMVEIPNKSRDLMGVTVNLNEKQENGKRFLEIIIPAYTIPISLRGRYYFRSGSTNLELTGTSLTEFLLRKCNTFSCRLMLKLESLFPMPIF